MIASTPELIAITAALTTIETISPSTPSEPARILDAIAGSASPEARLSGRTASSVLSSRLNELAHYLDRFM